MRVSEIIWDEEQCFLAVLRDVTDRREIEEKNKEYSEQLKRANQDKDKFFSIIAHDLKSPFQGLLGLSEVMADKSSDISLEEFILYSANFNELAANLFKLIENLLEWSRMQSGLIICTPEIINVNNIVRLNLDLLTERAKQKEISLLNEVPDSINVYADLNMTNTLLRNLISNAVKFTNKKGIVRVSANKNGDNMIEISVHDSGIGIPESDISKLFKVGENVKSNGTDGELSTGLGLILCSEFIEINGGKIWVESEEGKGSTFYFTLRKN
jgi:signal transduction histidine kinase